ncbi:hypothetical protein SJ05684_c26300 [Sinorhizobium sojae CCBAU 05684]|uniref:Uncharacterized protein n=1 Tax=Sinorhizobium sojae CCBAU 05684 TaxID=716928 RepID=A0A249PDP8_9HYPH|nr:hypothetical protein SJ05684_c26300 [Sinorhizobium sojae CCBAU 05684]
MDAVQICDGSPAEFHHDACHFASTVPTGFPRERATGNRPRRHLAIEEL